MTPRTWARNVALTCTALAVAGCGAGGDRVRQPGGPAARAAEAGEPQPFRLTSGLYELSMSGQRNRTDEVRLLCERNVVRVVDTDDSQWPGQGRIDGDVFTLRAADEKGELRMTGRLTADDTLEGTAVLTRAGGGEVRELGFTMRKIGPVTAPWSRGAGKLKLR